MVTSKDLIAKYGDPRINTAAWEARNMASYSLPANLVHANGHLPGKVYCNRDFAATIIAWLTALATTAGKDGKFLIDEIKTWDGCFNIRMKRGQNTLSVHAFGMAVDINAAHNPFMVTREQAIARGLTPFSEEFLAVSRKHMECGADWATRPDGMHYQIKQLAA